MTATHPDKQAVRDLMAQHRAENTPPLSMDEIRRSLGWHLIEAERKSQQEQR